VADRSVDFLLIGGGLAAANCARTLRDEGADGSILLVGREADPPYDRPPLSKGYLAGKEGRDDALVRPDDWWRENDVELLTRTSAMKLDADVRTVKLSTREEVGFDRALLATGANVRRLRAEGGDLEGIHYLRAFANADAIRFDAEQAERIVVVGGSFIGCEVAATLTAMGRSCAIVMMEETTLDRPFGREVGGYFHRALEEHGVDVHGSDELERFEGSDGRVGRVVTRRGREIDCDCVVMGTGVVPDTMLAKAAKLELGEAGGVKCSSRLETSLPGVYAAGDMAEWESELHGGPVRIEHWDVAFQHGRTAALNMLGRDEPHAAVPYFWSDLADWAKLEYVGVGLGDDVVVRGSIDDGKFTVFSLDGGRLVSAATVGRPHDLGPAREMISERTRPDSAALADVGADLAAL
jgi:3-phenylpropionate/trans-cinnamate dioxygenase ferredoxin reductase component